MEDVIRRCFAVATVVALVACGGLQSPAGAPVGVPYSLMPSNGNFAYLYTFKDYAEGAVPQGPLVPIGDTLYGTASGGGTQGRGTVFAVTTSGDARAVYSFGDHGVSYHDGASPWYLIVHNGLFYGSTYQGGLGDDGAIFTVTKSGKERVLFSFKARISGASPTTLVAINDTIYGIAQYGRFGNGLVFSITPSGTEHALHLFKGRDDGADPLALVAAGNELYGTTYGGGTGARGTVFKLDLQGKEHVLYNFDDISGSPVGPLVYANGQLYGTTANGGVFAMTTAGKEHVITTKINGGFLSYENGALYDVSGAYTDAAIYRITLSGHVTKLHQFTAHKGGRGPSGPLRFLKGLLYGVTGFAAHGHGTVYQLKP